MRTLAAARLLSALTLGSRLLGLARECVLGYFFGTSELLSAFRIAFMVPNLARRLFGEGALSAAVIPVLSRTLQDEGEQAGRRLTGAILTLLVAVTTALVLMVEAALAAARTASEDPALKLTAILLPYLPLICTVAVIGGVLNVRGRFATPALCPMILNLAVIGAATAFGIAMQWTGLALMQAICAGVLAAGVVQLALVAGNLKTAGFAPLFNRAWKHPQVKQVLQLMGPMILGLSAVQLNTLFDYVIAYFFVIEDGQRIGPAVLGYAHFLYQLPLGVFGIALATALFPSMAASVAEDNPSAFAQTLRHGLRMATIIALPATVGLCFIAKPLVATLYQRGAFNPEQTVRVAAVLQFYSLGMVGYFVQHLLIRAHYSRHDSRTPARIAGAMVVLNLAMNLVLVQFLEERGLALATAICAFLQCAALHASLRKTCDVHLGTAAAGYLLKVAAACAGMLLALFGVGQGLSEFRPIVQVAGCVLAGGATYALCARLLGLREFFDWLRHRSPATTGR